MPIIVNNTSIHSFTFNGGERHVKIVGLDHEAYVDVEAILTSSNDVMDLLLVADALKRMDIKIDTLLIPYFPYSRQDRVCNYGEALSVSVMANLINSIKANEVVIQDPHSSVTFALINNLKIEDRAKEIFKDPKTDNGTKKSAKGLLKVVREDGKLKLIDQVEYEDTLMYDNLLQTVFHNGTLLKELTLQGIRNNVAK